MVATPSTMLPLGTPMPSFQLPNAVDGSTVSHHDMAGARALLVMFICNHCPYVKHVKRELGRIAADYSPSDLAVVAINANDVTAHPDDAPEKMKALAKDERWRFPYLFDESQEVAKRFHAACTPDFFLFDRDRVLVYRGQLDDSRPGNDAPVTGKDLRAAIDTVLTGGTVPAEQKPSMGCNIKWKAGNAPEYFGSA